MYIEQSSPISSGSPTLPICQATELLSLKNLESLQDDTILALLKQLSSRGFACVTLDHDDLNYNLERALDEAADLQGFTRSFKVWQDFLRSHKVPQGLIRP